MAAPWSELWYCFNFCLKRSFSWAREASPLAAHAFLSSDSSLSISCSRNYTLFCASLRGAFRRKLCSVESSFTFDLSLIISSSRSAMVSDFSITSCWVFFSRFLSRVFSILASSHCVVNFLICRFRSDMCSSFSSRSRSRWDLRLFKLRRASP